MARLAKIEPTTHLGHRLRELRGELTYQAAADRLGVAESVWRRWELGERVPSVAVLVRIAEVFGVNVLALLADAAEVSK